MGSFHGYGRQTFRIGTGCLYGKGQLQPETLPPFYHADVRSRSDRLAQYEYTCGPRHYHQAPELSGSLGTAISEAVELAMQTPNCKYVLGSVLNHVMLHQTVIGLEAEKQMEMAGEYPDVVIACFGGGSNFSGIAFPFLRHKLTQGKISVSWLPNRPPARN